MPPEPLTPLVIFAIDAGDKNLIEGWIAEGRLPALARLRASGCHGRTAGPEHACEHGSWVTTFSGVSRNVHGYYSYRQLKPREYLLENFSPREAKAQPFWTDLRGSGKRVAVLDAPEVLPVSGLDGVQLANWATHQPDMAALPARALPPEALDEARHVFGSNVNISEFDPGSSIAEDLEVRDRLLERVRRRGELYRHFLASSDFDLVVLGFYEGHKGSHRFWDYRDQAQGGDLARQHAELSQAVRDLYEATDQEIGRILDALPEANVVVVSLYGMKDEYPTTDLMDSFLRTLGYQPARSATDGDGGRRSIAATIRRLVPDGLRTAVARRMPHAVTERLIAERFRRTTDWSATTAFAIPALFTSFLRVNLRGREPNGIVAPGDEYTATLDRLTEDLLQIVDPVDDRPAVSEVLRTVEIFGDGPPDLLPDLFVEWTPTTHLRRRLVHPRGVLSQATPPYLRGNEHSHQGLLIASGPSIAARGDIGDISILDLAPTFLELIGMGSDGLKGRPLSALQVTSTR